MINPFDPEMQEGQDLAGSARYPGPMDGPIPGQSLTSEKGKFPYERPPELTDTEDILDWILTKFTNRDVANRLLSTMEMGVPLTIMVETIVHTGVAEGKFPMQTGMLMAPAISVVLMRMAEKAGIEPRLSEKEDFKGSKLPSYILHASRVKPDMAKIDKAVDAARESRKDFKPSGEMKSTKLGLKIPVGGLGSSI